MADELVYYYSEAWSVYNPGDKIIYEGKELTFGVDAFADMSEAFNAAMMAGADFRMASSGSLNTGTDGEKVLHVCSCQEWKDCLAGAPCFVGDDMFIYGTDAFSSIEDALANVSDTTRTKIIVYNGNYGDVVIDGSVVGKNAGIVITAGGDLNAGFDIHADEAVFESFTVKNCSGDYDAAIAIDGVVINGDLNVEDFEDGLTIKDCDLKGGIDLSGVDGEVTVSGNKVATAYVDDFGSDVQFGDPVEITYVDADGNVVKTTGYYGVNCFGSAAEAEAVLTETAAGTAGSVIDVPATIDKTKLYVDASWAGKQDGDVVESGDGTKLIFGTNAFSNFTDAVAAAPANVETIIKLADNITGTTTIDSGKNIKLVDASGSGAVTISSGAKVHINNGIFTADKIINNTGNTYFSVKGESTVNINDLSGTGRLDVYGTLKDSTIKSSTTLRFFNAITFTGDNYLKAKDFSTNENANFTIVAGASLETGTHFSLGGGRHLYATGSLAEGAALTLDAAALASTKKTLDLYGINIAMASTGVVTVTNAYADLGTLKTTSSSEGTYTYTFTNSYVEVTSLTLNDSKNGAGIGGFTLTLDGSVFTLGTAALKFSNTSVIVKNGSVLKTTSNVTNYGAISVTGSSVDIAGTITNTGDITVTDGSFAAGTITLSSGGTLSLSVSAAKLATIGAEGYTIVSQTASGNAIDALKVNIAGTEYGIGQSLTANGITYTVTNGDGNDIAIEASASTLYVNSAYTADSVLPEGQVWGFNAFSTLTDAVKAADSSTTNIKLCSDVDFYSDAAVYLQSNFVISSIDDTVRNINWVWNTASGLFNGNASDLTITFDKSVVINGESPSITFGAWNGATVKLEGETHLQQLWAVDGEVIISETAKVTIADETHIRRGGVVTVNGLITDTTGELASYDPQVSGGWYWNSSNKGTVTLNFTNTYWKQGLFDGAVSGSDGAVVINAKRSIVQFSDMEVCQLNPYIADDGHSISLTDQSRLVAASITLGNDLYKAALTAEDSSVEVSGALNIGSKGVLELSDSTLAASGISNSGDLTAQNGAEIAASGVITNSGLMKLDNAKLTSSAGGSNTFVNEGELKLTNGSEFTARHINNAGTITIDSSEFSTFAGSGNCGLNSGTISVVNGGTLHLSRKLESTGTVTIDNATLTGNSLALYVSDGTTFGTLNIVNGATYTAEYASLQLGGGGVLTVDNGAVVTIFSLQMGAGGRAAITGGSTVYAGNSVSNSTVGSNITIDATSTLICGGSIYYKAGSVTIDASNFAGGFKKIIDSDRLGSNSSFDNVTITGLGAGVNVLYGSDGDISLSDADLSKIYVNSEWNTLAYGEEILNSDGSVKAFFGVNAFTNVADALSAVPSFNTGEVVFESSTTGNVSGDFDLEITEDVAFTTPVAGGVEEIISGGDICITSTINATSDPDNKPLVTVGEGVTLKTAGTIWLGWYNAPDFAVNGTLHAGTALWIGAVYHADGDTTRPVMTVGAAGKLYGALQYVQHDDAQVTINGNAAPGVSADQRSVQFEMPDLVSIYSGTLTLNNTRAVTGMLDINNAHPNYVAAGRDYDGSYVVLNNSCWESASNIALSGVSGLTLKNGSEMIFGGNATIGASGVLTISDSKFAVGGVSNSGTITVSGNSTVKGVFSGNGELVFNNATIGSGIEISGTQSVIRFTGTNTMTAIPVINGKVFAGTMLNDDEPDTFVPEASTLTITGVNGSLNELCIGAQYKDGIPTDSEGNAILSTVNVEGNSTVAIDRSGAAGLVIRNSGVLNIESGSTVSVKNDIQTIIQGKMDVYGTYTNTDLPDNAANYGPFSIYKGGEVNVKNGGLVSIGKYEYQNATELSGLPRIGLDIDGKSDEYKSGSLNVEAGGIFNANGNLAVNSKGSISTAGTFGVAETLTNKGTITVNGGTFTAGTLTNNGGKVYFSNANINISEYFNGNPGDGSYTEISGRSTVKIDNFYGDYGFRVADGAELVDSVISGQGTTTLRALGDLTIASDFTLGSYATSGYAYFRRDDDVCPADLTIADGSKLTVQGQFNWYNGTISGGAIEARYVQLSENTVKTDITAENVYLYDGTVIDGVTVTHNGTNGEPIYVRGDITVENGGILQATGTNAIHIGASNYTERILTATSGAKVIAGSISVNRADCGITVTSGAGVEAGSITNAGVINVNNATIKVANTLTNNGTILMDCTSTIAFKTFAGSGTVTVDVSGYTDGSCLILDSLNNNYTEAQYQAILGSSYGTGFTVIGGDLYYVDYSRTDVYVNSEYSATGNNDGHIWGVDAFATVEDAAAVNPAHIITIGGTHAGITTFAGVNGTINDGSFSSVAGGIYVDRTDRNWSESFTGIDMTISGGSFSSGVVGGDYVYQGNAAREGNINFTISGGVFNNTVGGGMAYSARSYRYSVELIGDIEFTISGGHFVKRVYGGNISRNDYGDCTLVEGDINFTIDSSVNSVTFGEHIVAGSFDTGRVDGNINMVFTGSGDNLNFTGSVLGGSGATYRINGNGAREYVTYVTGDRNIAFSNFDGDFDGNILAFTGISFADGSEMALTSTELDLSDISSWSMEYGSSVNAAGVNDFTGDTLELDVNGWDTTAAGSWDIISGAEAFFTGWDAFSSVTIGGTSLSHDGTKWAGGSYELSLEDDAAGRKLVVAIK